MIWYYIPMEHDELAQHLESLQRENCYRVDAILKESPIEITQRVYFMGDNGAQAGPYIRKFIKRGFGVGGAYEQIFSAQQRGHRFKYIPDILECYMRDDELVVVMELVRGQTLQDAVYERDPSVELARNIFPKLCDAVGELHGEFDPPIIHRDLKPSNIILTGEGLALIDFGISREYDENADVDTTHFGTREFAPPEQYGFGQTGVYSDIYSLGMVLYFCLTEEIPNAQARKQAFHHVGVPEELRRVVERAVALDPAARFASTNELKSAFQGAMAEVQRKSGGGAAIGASNYQPKRKGAPTALVILVIACLALGAVFVLGSRACSSGNPSAAVSQSAESVSSEASAADSDASVASSSNAEEDATAEELELALDLGNQAALKDGFDPETNFAVEVAGVQFQIPNYFRAETSSGDDGESYFYAETGSSVAMIMTKETFISENADRAVFEAGKDDYVTGMMSAEMFKEVTGSTDCELAGFPARVVSISAAVKGVPAACKAAFFFNESTHTVGLIMFGQTINTQFDYSLDFAKVITSAKRV